MTSEARGWGLVWLAGLVGALLAVVLSLVLAQALLLRVEVPIEGASFYETARVHGWVVLGLTGGLEAVFEPGDGVVEGSVAIACGDEYGVLHDRVSRPIEGQGPVVLKVDCSGYVFSVFYYNVTVEPYTLHIGDLEVRRQWP